MATCPAGHQGYAQLIGPSYFECRRVLADYHIMSPAGIYPVGRHTHICLLRFKGGWKVDRSRVECAICRQIYSSDTCVECHREVCADHAGIRSPHCLCSGCSGRVAAEVAYEIAQPFLRGLATIRSVDDPIERLLRWARLDQVSVQVSGYDRATILQHVFYRGELKRKRLWHDGEIIAWFMARASAHGIKPEPTYRTWVARPRLFYGEDLVPGPKRAAWFLPGGADVLVLARAPDGSSFDDSDPLGTTLVPRDGYLLTDGSLMLDDVTFGQCHGRFTTRGLATLADILGL
jgi:hypothetical protein